MLNWKNARKMPGVKRATFYDVPSQRLFSDLENQTLREMGRTDESRTLLEAVAQETKSALTQQALKAEEEQLP